MKNQLFKYYIFSSFVLFGLFSCESDDDFLSEIPQTFYTIDNAFTSSSQVDQVILSCYNQLRWMFCTSDWRYTALRGNGTDIMDVAERRISLSFSDYSQLSPQSTRYNLFYSDFYELISKANTALYAANLEHISWSSESAKNAAIAQAKFFRAYAYRNLGELYGGVPLVDQVYTEAKYDFERSTRRQTYQFAIDDLESVLNDLPETTDQGGRIVRGAAQHYLCELYLAMGTHLEDQGESGDAMFQTAVQYANDVIDGGTYALMTDRFGTQKDREPGDVYYDLFRLGNVNYQDGNTECIWAFQIDFDAHEAEDGQSESWFVRMFMPAMRVLEGFVGTDPEAGGRGVTYGTPTWHVIDGIWEGLGNDNRNAEHNIQRTFYYNDPTYEKFGEKIPDEALYPELDRGMTFPIWWKANAHEYFEVGSGYPNSRLFRDMYHIRLAETILLRAEAHWRLGNNADAADDINMLRQRAQCDYSVSPGEVTLDFILDERARELYIEESRWNTLLRMGGTVAVDRIREYNIWPNGTAPNTLTFDYNLWPIPQNVIDRNKDVVLEQNPGWENR